MGRFCGNVRRYRSTGDPRAISGQFGLPSPHPKIPSPRGRVLAANAGGLPGILGVLGGQKRVVSTPVRNFCGFNSGAAAGPILVEHREVARPRCRVAAGHRPALYAASEIDNARSAGISRANANRTFGFCIVASSFKFRHNARLEYTAMSGDHLVEDEESPLPRIRKVASALD
jgi:hypothetical protein